MIKGAHIRGWAAILVLLITAVIAGCGSSSATSPIDIAQKTTTPVGMRGQIIKLEGDLVTVKGHETNSAGNLVVPTTVGASPTLTRTVKVVSSEGMRVGDQVYLTQTKTGGFEEDKAREARIHSAAELAGNSTCAEWEQASTKERTAFLAPYVAVRGKPPAYGQLLASSIGLECFRHSPSTIGALVAEYLRG